MVTKFCSAVSILLNIFIKICEFKFLKNVFCEIIKGFLKKYLYFIF